MPIRTRRWNDPPESGEEFRILITRYRPRGVSKQNETWDVWMPQLGPSPTLLAHFKGKDASQIDWSTYRRMYILEMRAQQALISELAARSAAGENIALLCASTCHREARCHRSILRSLIEGR